jgi:hypothetical protein
MQVHVIAADALQRLEDDGLEGSSAPIALAFVALAGGHGVATVLGHKTPGWSSASTAASTHIRSGALQRA